MTQTLENRVLLVQFRSDMQDKLREEKVIRLRVPEEYQLETVDALTTNLSECDPQQYIAIILGGSSDVCLSDHLPINRKIEINFGIFLDGILKYDVPTLGICFGLQVIGYHLDTPLAEKDAQQEMGTIEVQILEQHDPLFKGVPHQFYLQAAHHDALLRLPRGAVHLAKSEACPVQIFRMGKYVYAVQGHPERLLDDVRSHAEHASRKGYGAQGELHESLYGPALITNFLEIAKQHALQ